MLLACNGVVFVAKMDVVVERVHDLPLRRDMTREFALVGLVTSSFPQIFPCMLRMPESNLGAPVLFRAV